MKRVVVIPGDGVGPEVVASAISAIDTITDEIEFTYLKGGYDYYKETGNSLEPDSLEIIDRCDSVLVGTITVPPNEDRFFKNPVDTIARRMDLHVDIRPVERLVPDMGIIDISTTFATEYEDLSLDVSESEDSDGITLTRRLDYSSVRRFLETIRNQLEKNRYNKVTCMQDLVHYKETDKMFGRIFKEVMSGAPFQVDIENVNEIASYLIMEPRRYEMIVGRNPACDILSEEAAALIGGAHLMPTAIVNDRRGIFKPFHSPLLRKVGTKSANPTAELLSASWMLMKMDMRKESQVLYEAVRSAYKRNIRMKDTGGNLDLDEFTEAIIDIVKETPVN